MTGGQKLFKGRNKNHCVHKWNYSPSKKETQIVDTTHLNDDLTCNHQKFRFSQHETKTLHTFNFGIAKHSKKNPYVFLRSKKKKSPLTNGEGKFSTRVNGK